MKAILWPLIGLLVLLALAWTTLFGLARGSDSPAAKPPSPTFTTTPRPAPTTLPTADGSPADRRPSEVAGEPSFLDRLRGRAGSAAPAKPAPQGSTAGDKDAGGSLFERLRGGRAEEPDRPGSDSRAGPPSGVSARNRDPSAATRAGGPNSKLMIVLDASGSMARENRSGGTSMSAAQDSVDDVLGRIAPETQVGLRVFGSEVDSGGKPTPQACRDTRLITPLAPLDRSELHRSVRSFRPVGETPIGYAVEQAIADLGPSGDRSILLVSDGEESCRPDPCEALREAERSGVDVQINTVGVRVNETARRQLSCLAHFSGGTYTEARSDRELTAALRSALNDFSQAAASSEADSPAGSAVSRDANSDLSAQGRSARGSDSPGLTPGAAAAAIIVLLIAASGVKRSRRK